MFEPLTVIIAICLYMALLFAIAQWTERRVQVTGQTGTHPLIYALSINVYVTASSFYGAAGIAVNYGSIFLALSVGAIIGIAFWWVILRRLVHLKEVYRITSIADLISTRYNRSQTVAALVTLIALIGTVPYIALQLKAVVSTFGLITARDGTGLDWGGTGILITLFMILFTVIFGVRRLDPTERHQGVMTALAFECIVKLVAMGGVAVLATYLWFDGFSGLIERLRSDEINLLRLHGETSYALTHWLTLVILGISAMYLLPRQFHVEVIENSNRRHILLAMLLVPIYLILFRLFVFPIAAGGMTAGLPASQADTYVLLIPNLTGYTWMTLFVFIGGFSAATGMIIVSAMTLSTMATNHLVLPLIERIKPLTPLRHYLLQCRWLMVAVILLFSYVFARSLSGSYLLTELATLAMAAILQLAPILLGGLFWSRGNRAGALTGLAAGFAVWTYTLLLPAFVHSGWLPMPLLTEGPWGIAWLKPQALLGISGLPPISHCMIWSLACNTGGYVLGSLLVKTSPTERSLALEFIKAQSVTQLAQTSRPTGLQEHIELKQKLTEAQDLLDSYLPPAKVTLELTRIVEDLQIESKSHLNIMELVEFHRLLERVLAGSIGAAAAHRAIRGAIQYTERETEELQSVYSHVLSELLTTPQELEKQIQFFKKQSEFEHTRGDQLETKVLEREARIRELENTIKQMEQQIKQLSDQEVDSRADKQ